MPDSTSPNPNSPVDLSKPAPESTESTAPASSTNAADVSNLNPAPASPESLVASRDSGANWFFWIVGISLVNTIISFFSSDDSGFALGLSATLLVDAGVNELIKDGATSLVRAVGLGFDLVIFGFYAWCGVMARKGHSWAFVLGGILFLLDTLLLLLFQSWLGVALHVWALVSIFFGWKSNQQLRRAGIAAS